MSHSDTEFKQVYTLPSRIAFAGWTPETISSYAGPTTDIVAGLAEHTRSTLQSTYTVSESGTAGPGGGVTPNRVPFVILSYLTSTQLELGVC